MLFKLFIILSSALLFASCRQVTVGEAMAELRSGKYYREIEAGNHKIGFRFIPESLYYLTHADVDTNTVFNKQLIEKLKKENQSKYGLMFSMTLSPREGSPLNGDFRNDVIYGGISGNLDYRQTLNKYMFGLKKNIWLEINGRKHELSNYHMSRSWGMTRSRSFVLMFRDINLEKINKLALVSESIVPGHNREKVDWKLPLTRWDCAN